MGIVIDTPPDNVAFSIALGVLLLSVVLHPIVRACFHRIRADRAWKSIENSKPVEVTKYHFFSEALGDRGRWDTARVVTIMLAVFHMSTWGLELSLDLALRTDGPVDLLNRPPPVVFRGEVTDSSHNLTDWMVQGGSRPVQGGTLNNFHGTLIDGNATTSYRVGEGFVHGNILFASWSTESARIVSGLFYDVDSGQALVQDMSCSSPSRSGAVYISNEAGETQKWGDATECESGPQLQNTSSKARASPPTILLSSAEGSTYLLVEEESSYPSFLYSVWEPGQSVGRSVELNHAFFISSTTRLAEAIVTGVVNGYISGGGCVDLLTQFSVSNSTYVLQEGSTRVSPFGEHPRSSSVASLDQVEPIVAGVLVSAVGTICGVLLISVTAAAFVGAFVGYFCRRHSRSSLDVYNRDALIRAISLPSGEGADGKPAALKIYVRQEADNKAFSIVISDDGVYRGLAGLRKRFFEKRDLAAPEASNSIRSLSRSGSIPVGSRELTFDGVRNTFDGIRPALGELHHAHDPSPTGVPDRGRSTPTQTPVRLGARVVELIASPVVTRRGTLPARTLDMADLLRSSSRTLCAVPVKSENHEARARVPDTDSASCGDMEAPVLAPPSE